MFKSLLTIKTKLLLLAFIPFLIFVIEHFYIVSIQKEEMYSSRKKMLEDIVELTHNVVNNYKKLADEGKLSKKDAQNKALEYLKNMIYAKGNNYIFVYKYDGTVLSSPLKPKSIGKNQYNLRDKNGVQLIKELIDRAKEGGGFVNYNWTAGTKVNAPKISYSKGIDGWNWMIGTGVYFDDIEELSSIFINKIIIFFVFFSIFMLFFAFYVFNTIIGRINKIKDLMAEIAEGDGDLTVNLPIYGNDELTELSEKFNLFVEKIYKLVRNISDELPKINNVSVMVNESSDNLNISLNKTLENTKDSNKTVDLVNKKTTNTVDKINDVTRGMDNIINLILDLKNYHEGMLGSSNNLEDKIFTITAAIEEMNSTISEITQNTVQAANLSNKAMERSLEVENTMKKLTDMADDINKIVDIIKDISSQTNLLALNATIEAASAGDAGRGFAVVANEIKNLAKETESATKKINLQVNTIVEHSSASASEVKDIAKVIGSLNEVNLTISSSLEEQGAVISEISSNMSEAAIETKNNVGLISNIGDIITNVYQNSDNINNSVEVANMEMQELGKEVTMILESNNNISINVKNNLNDSDNLSASSSELLSTIDYLKATVSKFKL